MRRDGARQVVLPFEYGRVVRGDKLDQNIQLRAGDVVVVPLSHKRRHASVHCDAPLGVALVATASDRSRPSLATAQTVVGAKRRRGARGNTTTTTSSRQPIRSRRSLGP